MSATPTKTARGAASAYGASASAGRRAPVPDGKREHLDWLSLIEVSGPFLTLPVLLRTWPNLDALDAVARKRLRAAHSDWRADPKAGQDEWIDFVLRDLLEWREALRTDPGELLGLRMQVAEHETHVTPSFALVESDVRHEASATQGTSVESVRLLGLVFEPGTPPTARITGDAWAATPVDRMAQLCRHHGVELGLVTDGRWWALVWAPRGGVTTTAVFDTITWPEIADRMVVRAFLSLLNRRRFFATPENEQLIALLKASGDQGEEVTEQLGVQVRQAVELLVDAIGRAEHRLRGEHGAGLDAAGVSAYEVYRGAVAVMMRIVFLLFAEERRLLPSDNPLYSEAYSAGRLCEQLEERVRESSEEELEHSTAAWHRLLALFRAVHDGVVHPELSLHAYDGSIFDPDAYPWLEGRLPDLDGGNARHEHGSSRVAPLGIDDRTVYHMLLAVQYVQVGTGRTRERRRLTFRALDVEQIGYVYEGLLSFGGLRAANTVVGLKGKQGLEEEIGLADLEALARPFKHGRTLDRDSFAEQLAATYKDSGIGSAKVLAKLLAPPTTEAERKEIERRLHASTGDVELVERLRPFAGIIRDDLRGLPVVIGAGALYVTESSLRKTTGTHYTPKFLATQVAEGALEPLVYTPGPLQTADRSMWRLRSSQEILELKVIDIAMGSAAFLVAACRYLSDRLVEAWAGEGDQRAAQFVASAQSAELGMDAESDPMLIEARREIIEHCLYGVDINEMAVEMGKLSLWLISMDTRRPFTFLNDRLVTGDSLLGITSIEQLEFMNLYPPPGENKRHDKTKGVRGLVKELSTLRGRIAAVTGDSLDALAGKQRLLTTAQEKGEAASTYADLLVGAALSSAGHSAKQHVEQNHRAQMRASAGLQAARETARAWLATDQPEGGFNRAPLHWPLVFPEVFARGGFDAVIGNPPFLGGKKISGPLGSAYREYLVDVPGHGVKGNADLVAYFVLRAQALLNKQGQTGLIATNTLTQGDTREVGLDYLLNDGVEIRQAVKSEPWPSKSAVLQYCAIWTSRAEVSDRAARTLDSVRVRRITSSLDTGSRASGQPHRLLANQRSAFQGSNVVGIGFALEHHEAVQLVEDFPDECALVKPFLNGSDLNSSPEASASRQIIDFGNLNYVQAQAYPNLLRLVRDRVKPQRDLLPDYKRRVRENWWKYEHQARPLYEAIARLDRVIVIALVSKVVMPVMVPTGQVFSHKLGVFAMDNPAMLALLSSAPHYWWAITRSSTMKADLNYSPTDVFETFARPDMPEELRELGKHLSGFRSDLMLARQAGLTKTYNLVHDAVCTDSDIVGLREIHRYIDYAVARAYGWDDLIAQGLDHGFHDTRQGPRYTVGPAVRQEILDRLLELNHERHAAEQAAQGAKTAKSETLF